MSKPKSSLNNNEKDVIAAGQKMVKRGMCRVCDQMCSSYFYYGALCCEGCKQFFRRAVLHEEEPKCLCNSTCDLKKVKCRYCRFQKCLHVGMEPKFVNVKNKTEIHLETAAEVKMHFLAIANVRYSAFPQIKRAENVDDFINGLQQIERAFKRIWDSSQPLPEAYTNRHQTLVGFLQDNHNLLGNANQFPEEPFGWDKAQFIEEVEANGLFSFHAMIHYVKDWFIVVEFTKTLPFFKELSISDQICHLKHIYLSARFLINSFYSHVINTKCITRKNGVEMLALLEAKPIREDQKLQSILTQTSCNLVEEMSDCGLNYDEFLLLLAILLSNSNADGLSVFGRKKLYQKSIHYSKALQKLLYCKFGPIGGAQKFASLIGLLNSAINMKFKLLSMFAYMEVFYTKREMNVSFPQIMQSQDAKSSD